MVKDFIYRIGAGGKGLYLAAFGCVAVLVFVWMSIMQYAVDRAAQEEVPETGAGVGTTESDPPGDCRKQSPPCCRWMEGGGVEICRTCGKIEY